MTARTALLVLAALLAPAVVAPADEGEPRAWHPPIRIVGDAGFAEPSSGVVAGRGTAADPYVIRGWDIPMATWGVHIEGTRAHVVLEDVTFRGLPAGYGDGCLVLLGSCPAVRLVDAENVTVRRIEPVLTSALFEFVDVRDVRVEDVTSDALPANGQTSFTIEVRASERVEFVDLALGGYVDLLEAVDVDGLVLRGWDVDGPSALVFRGRVRDVAIEGTTMRDDVDVRFGLAGSSATDLALVGNDFASNVEVNAAGEGALDRVLVCGNRWTGNDVGRPSLALQQEIGAWSGALRVVGNAFEQTGGRWRAEQWSEVEVRDNVAHDARGALFYALGVRMTGNSFERLSSGVVVHAWTPSDLTGNWWGASDGPSGIGDGSGVALRSATPSSLTYAPWLSSPPTPSVDCAAERARPWA